MPRNIARTTFAALFAAVLALPLVHVAPAGAAGMATVGNGLTTTDLTVPGMTPATLAGDLAGVGVTVSNVSYRGAYAQAGRIHLVDPFVVSFNDGVILSSGNIADVVGPNKSDGITGDMAGLPGVNAGAEDVQLTALIAASQTVNPMTYDAAVLEFDFVPQASTVYFTYTFGSDEYLEWVNLFNDVFAFYVNGTNCATVPGGPVSIDTINDTVNPNLFRDNSFAAPPANPINIESDGLSVELICQAAVNAGQTNHMKLAIADTSDQILDSVVMIKANSLSTVQPESCNDGVDNDDDTLVDMNDDWCTSTTTPPPTGSGGSGSGGNAPAFTGNEGTPIVLDAAALGWTPSSEAIETSWAVHTINAAHVDCTITSPDRQPIVGGAIALGYAVCPNEGEYVAHLYGWDIENKSSFDYDVDFFVHNAPPAVDIQAPLSPAVLDVGDNVALVALLSDPGAGDVLTCSISWGDGSVDAGTYDSATGECTGSHGYLAEGSFVLTVTATDDAGDSAAAAALLHVSASGLIPQTILFTTSPPASAAYGDSFNVDAIGGGSPNPVTFSALGGCTNVGSSYTMTSSTVACLVLADQAGDSAFEPAPTASASVSAVPREISVTADPGTKAYGDADPPLTWSITSGSLAGSDGLTGALEREPGETPGVYAILQGTLAAPADYALTYGGATFSITGLIPQSIAWTTPPPSSVAYGDAVTLEAVGGGSPNPLAWSAAGGCTNVGPTFSMTSSTTSCVAMVDQAGDATYGAAPQLSATILATTRAITVTADPITKPYGAADPALTYQLTTGFLAGSDSLTGALTRDAGEDVGAYAIGQGTLAAPSADYELTFFGAMFTITGTSPAIGTNPASQTVVAGTLVTFAASASGNPAPTVQWEVYPAGGPWAPIAGATSATYTLTATTADSGRQYRAVFTNSVGSATTAAATLTVSTASSYTLSVAKVGSGTVTSSPRGIKCGTACSAAFAAGTTVTLTATAASGWAFAGWSGACTNATGTCSVAMDQARSVTATFSIPVKASTSLLVDPVTCTARTSCTLSAVLLVNGVPTAGVSGIKFTIEGKVYRGSTTNALGVSSVTITAPRILGPHTVTASWAGDTTRSSCVAWGTLNVIAVAFAPARAM